jgi:glycerophosphoryl diester phosphodiesterase
LQTLDTIRGRFIQLDMTQTARPLIIAHRGASWVAPENTLAAFRLAWEQGADGIEMDVRLSADRRVVCIHDEDTKRVTGQPVGLIVKDKTYDELKSLDVGTWKSSVWRGEPMPLLENVLAIVPAGKLAFVELKTGPEIVEPLADVLAKTPLDIEQVLVICFDEQALAACRQRLPRVRRHLLIDYRQVENGTWQPGVDEVITRLRRTAADGLGTQNRPAHVNKGFAAALRAAGVEQFHVWTVDDAPTARHYQRLGAWAITTNRPGELRQALGE